VIKAKVILFTSKKLKDGSHPLMLRITKNRVRKYISVGYSINDSEWNSKTGRLKGRSPKANELNRIIEKIEIKALNKIKTLEEEKTDFSIDDVVTLIQNKNETYFVFPFWETVIEDLRKTGKHGNMNAYKNTLSAFKKFRNNKDLEFASLDYKIVKAFDSYLLETGLQVNGISFHMRTLRALFNRTVKEDIASKDNYPFYEYKIKREKTIHRALTKEEVKRIRDLEFEDFYMKLAQDFFMFSFYTRGMSFIDMSYLKVKNLHNDRLQYRRSKTGQMFTIKLIPEAKAIIKKYADLSKKENYLFPIIQHEDKKFIEYKNAMRLTNKKLKIIGELAECSIPVTTYVARHSWATIAKRGGISTSVISEGLGHATNISHKFILTVLKTVYLMMRMILLQI
jgi:site-specific recombinase XerD